MRGSGLHPCDIHKQGGIRRGRRSACLASTQRTPRRRKSLSVFPENMKGRKESSSLQLPSEAHVSLSLWSTVDLHFVGSYLDLLFTIGWLHRLNGPEFEQAPGDGEGQGSLASPMSMGSQRIKTRLSDLTTVIHVTKKPENSVHISVQPAHEK